MTQQFIQNTLESVGESLDTWTTLEGKFQRIGLLGDSSLSIDPVYSLYYFSSSGFLCVKVLNGDPTLTTEVVAPEGYAIVSSAKTGKKYLIQEAAFGINTTIGKVHTIIGYDNIVAFYNPATNNDLYMQ